MTTGTGSLEYRLQHPSVRHGFGYNTAEVMDSDFLLIPKQNELI